MLTIVIIGLVSAMAAVQIGAARESLVGDGGMRTVLAQLNFARELSISQRRNMQLQFVGVNGLRVIRLEVPSGTTMLSSSVFEGRVEFSLTPGVPDTPDAFGNTQAVDFGGALSIMFTSDGTLIDQAGRPVNGTIFLTVRGASTRSVRAITILGATGRVRAFRWNGAGWTRV